MPEALIWGASGGIGSALVRALKTSEWQVHAAARDVSRVPGEADFTYEFSAGSLDSVSAACMLVAQQSDGLDLMVYAAGGIVAKPVEDMNAVIWERVIEANLTGAILTFRCAVPLLRETAHVMFIGAYIDRIGLPGFAAYAAAKAGLEPLVNVLQKEHRKLRFTLVRPGAVDTPFWMNVPFKLPSGAASPQSVAEAIMNRYNSGDKGPLDL